MYRVITEKDSKESYQDFEHYPDAREYRNKMKNDGYKCEISRHFMPKDKVKQRILGKNFK